MSARSASYGDPDLFVCSTPSRAYDIDENHVLVHALAGVHEAARLAVESGGDESLLRAVRRNGAAAARFLDHPTLRQVSRRKPNARAIKRTRSGKHRKWYAPALHALERSTAPLSASEVRAWCDERTSAQHHVLMGVIDRWERGGTEPLPALRAEHGALITGPVAYRHPRHLGDRATLSGVLIGDLLIDVPDRLHDPNRRRAADLLRARGEGRQTMVVLDERDLDRAVEVALEATGGR